MNKYDELLRQCCGNDPCREQFWNPNPLDDCHVATDGHILVKVPTELLTVRYRANPEYPDVRKVMPVTPGKSCWIKPEELRKVLRLIPLRKVLRYDQSIDEGGEVGEATIQCEGCGMYGKLGLERDDEHHIRFEGVAFKARYVDIIEKTTRFEKDRITLTLQAGSVGSEFYVGRIRFLLMPVRGALAEGEETDGSLFPDPKKFHDCRVEKSS